MVSGKYQKIISRLLSMETISNMLKGMQTIKGCITPRDIKVQEEDTSNKITIVFGTTDAQGNVEEATGEALEKIESYCV